MMKKMMKKKKKSQLAVDDGERHEGAWGRAGAASVQLQVTTYVRCQMWKKQQQEERRKKRKKEEEEEEEEEEMSGICAAIFCQVGRRGVDGPLAIFVCLPVERHNRAADGV